MPSYDRGIHGWVKVRGDVSETGNLRATIRALYVVPTSKPCFKSANSSSMQRNTASHFESIDGETNCVYRQNEPTSIHSDRDAEP